MNVETLNSYVLALIALLAMLFYLAVVVTGFRDLILRLRNRATKMKPSPVQNTTRGSRKAKRTK